MGGARSGGEETCLRGLSEEQVTQARRAHGSNRFTERRRRSFFGCWWGNLGDPVIRILLGALAVNLLICLRGGTADWVETCGIAGAVLLATVVSALSEYGGETAFARLCDRAEQQTCHVCRLIGGRPQTAEIPVADVVVGDLVLLRAGESAPADGILLQGRMRVDQSAMTGESREVEKLARLSVPAADASPLTPASPEAVYRGCRILQGEGTLRVTAVGDATYLGGISREVQEDILARTQHE